ncbi:MAG: AAA family ATPase [Desulfobulbaceae bacterium]|nr:AAA family ATPase [Desulfobulbaceae bacterium]
MKIAISGKGGVGKTTIMALLARELNKRGKKVLLIDADPSPHMAETIGIKDPGRITPIADMMRLLAERAEKTPGSPFYQLNPQVNDLIKDYMIEQDGLKLMVLGAIQKADSGCACPESHVLRKMLKKMLLTAEDVVLLDMEAGVEHLGRGTVAGVDHLLIVVIPSKSSIRTAMKIKRLAEEVGIKNISFIGNLIEGEEDKKFLIEGLGEKPAVFFPDSQAVRSAERTETPVIRIEDQLNNAPAELVAALLG